MPKGKTLVENLERETPVLASNDDEGETPVKIGGGEALEEKQLMEEEIHIYIDGANPELSEEAVGLVTEEAPEPVGGEGQLVVDLTDVPEGTDSPVNKRETRRQARRSLLDEIDDTAQPTGREVLDSTATETGKTDSPGPRIEKERRQAVERKWKGKQAAPSLVKKSKKPAGGKSVEVSLPPPAKVPYAKEPVNPAQSSESEEVEFEEPEEELNFEPVEVWITKGLLDAMRKFADPKQAATYKERCSTGKLAKLGKRYAPEELKEIDWPSGLTGC